MTLLVSNHSLCYFVFICVFGLYCVIAAPTNQSLVVNDVSLHELLKAEKTERLRLQSELDSLADKFTALESTIKMQRDTGTLYLIN